MHHVVLFHSVLGLREVEREIAAALEADGHRVSLPDLYGGARAESFADGFRLRENVGDEAMLHAARQAVSAAPADAVLAGLSLGAFLVGHFWAERPASPGALLLCGFAPWMTPRRSGMPVSAHLARPDSFDEEDFVAAWRNDAGAIALDLDRYDGVGHLFLDRTLPDQDAEAAALCLGRARQFLATLPVKT